MNTLEQIVYCSRSRLGPDEETEAIADIVHVAAFLNPRNGVTGALTLQDGVFVQVLEGAPSALDILMLHLHFDKRHEDIVVMARDRIDRRAFAAWGMTTLQGRDCQVLGRLIAERCNDLTDWRQALTGLMSEPA